MSPSSFLDTGVMSDDSIITECHTFYGTGEIETYRHQQLRQTVKDAKLKVWYPGRWQKNSHRALFRTWLAANDDTTNTLDGDNMHNGHKLLFEFISNAKIRQIEWVVDAVCEEEEEACTQTIKRDLCWESETMKDGELYNHIILQSLEIGNIQAEKEFGYLVIELDSSSSSEDVEDDTAIPTNKQTDKESDNRDTDDTNAEEDGVSVASESEVLYPPPCITLKSSTCGRRRRLPKWEWRNSTKWTPITSCYATVWDGGSMQHKHRYCQDIHPGTSTLSTEQVRILWKLWKFPHQVDLYRTSTVLPINQLRDGSVVVVDDNDDDNEQQLIYDFDRELFGKVYASITPTLPLIDPTVKLPTVKLRVGESLLEVMNDEEEYFEQCTDLSFIGSIVSGRSIDLSSCHLLAFRYVRIIIPKGYDVNVKCDAQLPLVQLRGSFVSSDHDRDNKVWNTAAYTLQLCIQNGFIVDGIKRDRLPWVGDLAVSIMANAYSFSDTTCVRWTLIVLGRCGLELLDASGEEANVDSHVNGMVDYSFWFIISHWLYQKYNGDLRFLQQEWKVIEKRLIYLVKVCSDEEKGWFIINEEDSDRIFIDWTVNGEKSSAVQILWWYAMDCGIALAEKLSSLVTDDDDDQNESKVFIPLLKNTQLRLENSFLEMEDIQHGYTRHSHIFGVVSGLYQRLDDRARDGEWWNPDSSDEHWKVICRCMNIYNRSREALMGNGLPPVATPYMKHLEILAMSYLGEQSFAIETVRSYFGGMLDHNATTFFEAFNENETMLDIAQFYDRPFARSLCHAWAAGPCALYPQLMLGLQPLSDGWKKFACDPLVSCCGSSVMATVTTKYGTIEVQLDSDNLQVSVPEGTTMVLMEKKYSYGRHSFARNSLISSQDVHTWSNKYRYWHHHPSHVIRPDIVIKGHEGIKMTDVPTVYQLPGDDSIFYMSFIGFDGVGYQSFVSESADLVLWTNPRLAMGYGEEGTFDFGGVVLGAYLYESYDIDAPRVLKRVNGKFYSLYGGYSSKGSYEPDPGSQGLASSEDGIKWKREKDESILSIYGPGIVKEWEKNSIYQPWLVEFENVYYDFYNAKKLLPEWNEQIGLATSTDLHNWTRHEDNPILPVSKQTKDGCTNNDGYDTQFAADAKVFWDKAEQVWVMFYFGVGKGGAHIMVAYSKDLTNWIRDLVPVYMAGSNPSGLDKQHAHKISLIRNPQNNIWYMFYCAVGDSGRGIGLITSKSIK